MTRVEELREPVYNDVAHYLNDCGHGYNSEEEAAAEIDSLIAAALCEGASRARMSIRLERDHVPRGPNERCVIIPVSAFYPTPPPLELAKNLPTVYGDALPIEETPCSG